MENIFTIALIVITCFILFVVYFIFKQIEFVLVAVNLYKQILAKQEDTVRLLRDIRDNTKEYNATEPRVPARSGSTQAPAGGAVVLQPWMDDAENSQSEIGDMEFCYHCGEELKTKSSKCPSCGNEL